MCNKYREYHEEQGGPNPRLGDKRESISSPKEGAAKILESFKAGMYSKARWKSFFFIKNMSLIYIRINPKWLLAGDIKVTAW